MECYSIFIIKSRFSYVSVQSFNEGGNKYENNYSDMSDQARN